MLIAISPYFPVHGINIGMIKKKPVEKPVERMKPFLFRTYKRHRAMIKDLTKGKDVSESEVIRTAIEEMHSRSPYFYESY